MIHGRVVTHKTDPCVEYIVYIKLSTGSRFLKNGLASDFEPGYTRDMGAIDVHFFYFQLHCIVLVQQSASLFYVYHGRPIQHHSSWDPVPCVASPLRRSLQEHTTLLPNDVEVCAVPILLFVSTGSNSKQSCVRQGSQRDQ